MRPAPATWQLQRLPRRDVAKILMPRSIESKQPAGMTVAQLWAAYRQQASRGCRAPGHKRAGTIKRDIRRYNLHIAPKLGSKAASESR